MILRLLAIVLALTVVGPISGQTAFAPDPGSGIGFGPGGWKVAAINTDPRPDFVGASAGNSTTTVLSAAQVSFGATGYWFAIAPLAGMTSLGTMFEVGDLDGDAQGDVVATDGGATLFVHIGTGSGNFAGGATGLTGFLDGRLADVDGDGDLDVLGIGAAGVVTALGDGSGTLVAGPGASLSAAPAALDVGDVDGDGDVDALCSLVSGGVVVVWNDGLGNFTPAASLAVATTGAPAIRLVDVDGVNGLDLITLQGAGGLVSDLGVAFNDGTGNLGSVALTPVRDVAPGTWSLDGGDLDQDGLGDVVALRTPDGSAGSTLSFVRAPGGPTGLFPPETVLAASAYDWDALQVVDWDSDGDLDVFVRAPDEPFEIAVNLLAGNHDGLHGPFLGGCIGATPTPTLAIAGSTAAGATASILTTGGPANTNAFLLIGVTPGRIEALPSCWLGVADFATGLQIPNALDASGASDVQISVPPGSGLTGARVVLQNLIAGPGGVEATHAVLAVLE